MDESKESWWTKKYSLCVFKKKKNNIRPEYWVGHSKLGYLDIDELFKITPNFDDKEKSVSGITEEEKEKKTIDDANKNAEDNGRIHKDK